MFSAPIPAHGVSKFVIKVCSTPCCNSIGLVTEDAMVRWRTSHLRNATAGDTALVNLMGLRCKAQALHGSTTGCRDGRYAKPLEVLAVVDRATAEMFLFPKEIEPETAGGGDGSGDNGRRDLLDSRGVRVSLAAMPPSARLRLCVQHVKHGMQLEYVPSPTFPSEERLAAMKTDAVVVDIQAGKVHD